MQAITTTGLDIGKSVFQVHGVDDAGQVVMRRQLKRRYVLKFFEKLAPAWLASNLCLGARCAAQTGAIGTSTADHDLSFAVGEHAAYGPALPPARRAPWPLAANDLVRLKLRAQHQCLVIVAEGRRRSSRGVSRRMVSECIARPAAAANCLDWMR
jgi:hypothetical protein